MAACRIQLFQRRIDHPALDGRRRIILPRARAPAVAGTIYQNHPMLAGKPVAERLPHGLQVRAGAMDQHNGRTGSVARPEFDDVERCAGHLDHLALCGIGALQDNDAGLCDQRQDQQRRHETERDH